MDRCRTASAASRCCWSGWRSTSLAAITAVNVSEFQHLLWARMVQGFGGAAGRILVTAIVRDLLAGRQMARVMSIVMTVFVLVPIFAPAVGQGIAKLGDWRTIFYFLIAVAILLVVWSSNRLPETRKTAQRAAELRPGRGARSSPTARRSAIRSPLAFCSAFSPPMSPRPSRSSSRSSSSANGFRSPSGWSPRWWRRRRSPIRVWCCAMACGASRTRRWSGSSPRRPCSPSSAGSAIRRCTSSDRCWLARSTPMA